MENAASTKGNNRFAIRAFAFAYESRQAIAMREIFKKVAFVRVAIIVVLYTNKTFTKSTKFACYQNNNVGN